MTSASKSSFFASIGQTFTDVSTADAQAAAAAAQASEEAAAAVLVQFNTHYLGAFASDPTLDDAGHALVAGALYFNTASNKIRLYTGAVWEDFDKVSSVAGRVGDVVLSHSDISGLAAVATSGLASDITGLAAVATSGSASDITGLAAVATSGAAADLSGLAPVATSGSATDLAAGTLSAARLPASGATAGTYGSTSNVVSFTVDATGRITAASTLTPAASAPALSSLTDVTITSVVNGQLLKWNGTKWVNVDHISALVFSFDGAGSAPTANSTCDLSVPFDCTIVSSTVQGDVAGSCVLDVWVAAFSTTTPPAVANTITASALPTLSSATGVQDSTLTGWTTAITAGQSVRVNVNSASTLTKITLTLKVKKTS
jgi:hypothetical protein